MKVFNKMGVKCYFFLLEEIERQTHSAFVVKIEFITPHLVRNLLGN